MSEHRLCRLNLPCMLCDADKIKQYEAFIKKVSELTVHNKAGDKPTKLALEAKAVLEKWK